MRSAKHGTASLWLTLSCLLACGGDDAGEASQGGSAAPAGAGAGAGEAAPDPSAIPDLRCATGEFQVQGMLSGAVVAERGNSSTHAFINKLGDDPGSLELVAGQIMLAIWFDQLLGNGRSVPARGAFSSASADAGNCESGDNPGAIAIDEDGDGVRFVLGDLHESPYCQGVPVSGMLAGCFRFPASGFP